LPITTSYEPIRSMQKKVADLDPRVHPGLSQRYTGSVGGQLVQLHPIEHRALQVKRVGVAECGQPVDGDKQERRLTARWFEHLIGGRAHSPVGDVASPGPASG
jgi:hypothetical protein